MVETGDPGALRIGFVVFPGITQLDLTGPFEVLSRLATPPAIGARSPVTQVACDLVAKTWRRSSTTAAWEFCPRRPSRIVPRSTSCACPAAPAWSRRWTMARRWTSLPGRARCALCHRGLYRGLPAGGGGASGGAAGDHALGLCRPAAAGRRGADPGAGGARRQPHHCGRGDRGDRLRPDRRRRTGRAGSGAGDPAGDRVRPGATCRSRPAIRAARRRRPGR